MNLEYKDKLNKIAGKMGVIIVPVKNLNDIYTKCDGFTMVTDFSSNFKKNTDIRSRNKG